MVLIMSVNPGFGGQKFIEHSVEKVRELRELITLTGSQALIEVDGGVNLDTGARLIEAGADALVAGNAVFSAPDPEEAIRALRRLFQVDYRILSTASVPSTFGAVGGWNSMWRRVSVSS